MYKDKNKQKEANRQAAQRRRDKAKSVTEGITIKSEPVIPIVISQARTSDREFTEMMATLPLNSGYVKVDKPGDDSYVEHTGSDEHCRGCHSVLPRLEQPRVHAGTCGPCAWKT